jgi:hypothetical protein
MSERNGLRYWIEKYGGESLPKPDYTFDQLYAIRFKKWTLWDKIKFKLWLIRLYFRLNKKRWI